MKYRPEIDGLRAISVAPVILFHAGFDVASGGFVGVDVFFVISGFLITTIILEDLQVGRFSLWNFYERRARRILPILLVVIVVCVPIAWFTMMPDPLENFGQSIVATLFFSNNVLLYLTTGYWDLRAEFKPLLHTWSLGIEEQFYILFPLFFLVTWRLGLRGMIGVTLLLLLASFLTADVIRRTEPAAAFHLLHTRGWELLVGAFLAMFIEGRHINGSNLLSGAGIFLIIGAVVFFDASTPFPSFYTLFPVLGAVLVLLFARDNNLCARLLSLPPLLGLGLISYSAYLWHQPVFAFARIVSANEPDTDVFLGLILLVLTLAWVSWRYIEQPARRVDVVPIKPFLSVSIITSLTLGSIGYAFHAHHGYASRFYPDDVARESDLYISYNSRIYRFIDEKFSEDDRPRVLVLGNSFARDFANVLLESHYGASLDVVYRPDLSSCLNERPISANLRHLVKSSDMVFMASDDIDPTCVGRDVAWIEAHASIPFIVGPKHFGYNLNHFTLQPRETWSGQTNDILPAEAERNEILRSQTPTESFIDMMALFGPEDGRIFVFDRQARLMSSDRVHLTRFGAKFAADRLFSGPNGQRIQALLGLEGR